MSDNNQNNTNQPAPTPAQPNNSPQTVNPMPQQATPSPPPSEDPFALDRRLIGEIQKGRNPAEEQKVVQQRQITPNNPPEKK